MEFISAYSVIRNKEIFLNGSSLYRDNSGDSLRNFLQNAYHALPVDYPKFYKMDPLSQAGFLACEVLLSHLSIKEYDSQSVAIVFCNAHSSLDTDRRYFETLRSVPSPSLFVYTLPNIVQGELGIRHRIKGENTFFISERFDETLLFDFVRQMLAGNQTMACVAGWVDVMNEHHDVLLYLVEKAQRGLSLEHSAAQIKKLYQ